MVTYRLVENVGVHRGAGKILAGGVKLKKKHSKKTEIFTYEQKLLQAPENLVKTKKKVLA